MRYDYIDILLTDDDGEETEVEVRVYFQVCRAEPDVGFMHDYADVSHVSMSLFLGEIIFTPTDAQEALINEWADIAIYEGAIYGDI